MMNNFLQSLKEMTPEFFKSYCIICGSFFELKTIEQMGYRDFSFHSKMAVPLKLYKYFPDIENKQDGKSVNYSINALKNNTVYLQSPMNFDDCYDSDISVDYAVYEKNRLIEYCNRCNISIDPELSVDEIRNRFLSVIVNSFYKHKNYKNIFSRVPEIKIVELENTLFCELLSLEMQKRDDLGMAVSKIMQKEYSDFLVNLKETFRVSCFTTTPFSQLMWGGSYANGHKGFCLEYTVLPNDKQYQDIFYNLFPVIYCKTRNDISEQLVAMKSIEYSEEQLWDICFHGVLRKSIDWVFQDEWRLLLPLRKEKKEEYNIKIFPITRVYLGNLMPAARRKEIIDICIDRNIPVVGVKKNKMLFEMQEGGNCLECKKRCF